MVQDIFYIRIQAGKFLPAPESFYSDIQSSLYSMQSEKRILLIHLGGGIGDLLLSTALLQPLKERLGGTHLAMMVRRGSEDILKGNPFLDEILPVDSNALKSWTGFRNQSRLLRERSFGVGIVLWSTAEVAWLLRLSGVPVRVGQGSRLLYSFLYTHRVRVRSEYGDTESHWVDCLLDYVRALGCEIPMPSPSSIVIKTGAEEQKRVDELLAGAGYQEGKLLIGFSIGKGLPLNRERWPVEYFALCADELARTFDAAIVLTGDRREEELVREAASVMKSSPLNLAGKTTLRELAALIGRCGAFVCPDSAPMHIAAAMGVPAVGLFAQKSDFPRRWRPYASSFEVLVPQVNSCALACVKERCPRFSCYEQITPERIAEAVSRLLRSSRPL